MTGTAESPGLPSLLTSPCSSGLSPLAAKPLFSHSLNRSTMV
jgi:hypothetical protein